MVWTKVQSQSSLWFISGFLQLIYGRSSMQGSPPRPPPPRMQIYLEIQKHLATRVHGVNTELRLLSYLFPPENILRSENLAGESSYL